MRLALLAVAFLAASCGCIDEITLRPEMSVEDLALARTGAAAVDVTFKFKDCCPSSEQTDIALALQGSICELWDELVAGHVDLQRYNDLVRAAHDSILQVILVCSSPSTPSDSPQLKDAWARCGAVADRAALVTDRKM